MIGYIRFSTVLLTFFLTILTLEMRAQSEISIGNQIWMKKNLNVDRFRNGDIIKQAKTKSEWEKAGDSHQPAWCYYKNNSANGEKYGKLYNWYAVSDPRGLAPLGWHVPTDSDWNEFITQLGDRYLLGERIKSKTGWNNNGNGKNQSGFTALPGGTRDASEFSSIRAVAAWWSSSETNSDFANGYFLESGYDDFSIVEMHKSFGYSVRCVKDQKK